MSDFPCTNCNLCCRLIGNILAQKDTYACFVTRAAIDSFPYKTDESGTCEKLVDGKCSVYEQRPVLCNIAAMGALRGYSKADWYRLSAHACNLLITAAGLDDSYLIKDYDPVN